MSKDKSQTPKEPQKETPKGAGPKGESEQTSPKGAALSPEEETELNEFREIKKETGFTKFKESAREAQRLNKENEELKEKLEESGAALSEDDLKKMIPDYDMMNEDERKEAKKNLINERRLRALEAKEQMRRDYEALPANLRKKIEKKGGYDKFRDYACLPGNAGQKDLENLAKSYLYDEKDEEDTEEIPPETPEVPGLEEPGAGEPHEPPSDKVKLTREQVAKMRNEDPKGYAALIKSGKLEIVS